MAGYPAFASQNVRADLTKGSGTNLSAIFFGNWEDLLIGLWGPGIEILTDPFTGAMAGLTRLSVFAYCDIGLRHAASFSCMKDGITT